MKASKTSLMMIIVLSMSLVTNAKAQGDWEPQKRFTGYVSSEFNYFNNLEGYNNEYGVALSEAGLLASYQPRKDVMFKMVFVYRPGFAIDQMLNEANVQYSLSGRFNVKFGRFLTPLSPMNTYYYAPVNTSATLPVLVSNHEFFPLNMDAVSVNGIIGNDFSVSYDVFAGGYRNTTWMKTGAIGFFGDEVAYYKRQIQSRETVDPAYNNTYNVGFGGNIKFALQDYINLGFSAFKAKDETMPIGVNLKAGDIAPGSPAMYVVREFNAKKFSYGANIKLKYNNTKLIGETWKSDVQIDDDAIDLFGSFVELSHTINRITPYVRYEDQTTNDIDYKRYTVGAMYKPTFETTFKMEYMHYTHKVQNIDGLVVSLIYSF